jgi:hypothetical protein
MEIKKQMQCDHEPDPATIEYDDRHGRRAICRKCGAGLVMSRYFLRAGEAPDSGKKRLTSKQKREMIRKGFQSPVDGMAESFEQDNAEGRKTMIVKGSSVPLSTVSKEKES